VMLGTEWLVNLEIQSVGEDWENRTADAAETAARDRRRGQ